MEQTESAICRFDLFHLKHRMHMFELFTLWNPTRSNLVSVIFQAYL